MRVSPCAKAQRKGDCWSSVRRYRSGVGSTAKRRRHRRAPLAARRIARWSHTRDTYRARVEFEHQRSGRTDTDRLRAGGHPALGVRRNHRARIGLGPYSRALGSDAARRADLLPERRQHGVPGHARWGYAAARRHGSKRTPNPGALPSLARPSSILTPSLRACRRRMCDPARRAESDA